MFRNCNAKNVTAVPLKNPSTPLARIALLGGYTVTTFSSTVGVSVIIGEGVSVITTVAEGVADVVGCVVATVVGLAGVFDSIFK